MPDGCYTIDETTVPFSDEDYIGVYSDCDDCTSNNPTPTPTVTPSNTPDPEGCNEWDLEGGPPSGGSFSYTDCNGDPQTENGIPDGDSVPVCALGRPVLTSGNGTVTLVGPCPSVTPTPTPTNSPGAVSPTPTPSISVSPSLTPSAGYTYWLISSCPGSQGGSSYSSVRIPSNVSVTSGNSVLMPDGCYNIDEAGGVNSNDYITFYPDCTACLTANPTPTPTPSISLSPTPTPSPSIGASPTPSPSISVTPSITPSRSFVTCNAVDLEFIAQGSITPVPEFACANYVTFYIDTSDFCTASDLHRVSDCTRNALSGFYNDGTEYRFWDGSSFQNICTSTDCP